MRINDREISGMAKWSLRIALFMGQLMIVTVLLHRFASLATPVAVNLLVVTLMGAATAILLAVLAFFKIWSAGIRGTGRAFSGFLVSLAIVAVPLYHMPSLLLLPAINDVSTDLLSPPQFEKIADLRDEAANDVEYPGPVFISKQAKAYPDIGSLMLERSVPDSYEMVRDVVTDLGWDVVNDVQPAKSSPFAKLEAVDRSLILGYRDDVVIRIQKDRNIARIDMRSASRYGRHDVGANANRIRNFFGVIKTRIARAEARKLDAIERARIQKQQETERKKRELEKKRRKAEELANAPAILPKANFDQVGLTPEEEDEYGGAVAPSGTVPSRRRNGASGFDFINDVRRKPRTSRRKASSRNRNRIKRSQRKRRKKNWVPFNVQVN